MRRLATIQKILDIQPIEGADKIERAKIKDWWVVIQKGLHQIGEKVVYFEIDSFLPNIKEYSFLLKGSSPKKMLFDGKEREGIRLKTIRLRGQISQGLIMPLSTYKDKLSWLLLNTDVSETLNVIKYEQPIPANLSGVIKGSFPEFIRKTDEERIQNCVDILERNKDKAFYVTEKIDGSSVTYYKKDGEFGVCSRNWELKETKENTIWDFAKKSRLIEKLPDNYAIQGEIIGPGVQGNPLKRSEIELYVFNVFDIKEQKFLDYAKFVKFCFDIEMKIVPLVADNYLLDDSIDILLEFANGKSLLNPNKKREGLVFRPLIEQTEEINGSISRLSFKVVSNEYLLTNEQ